MGWNGNAPKTPPAHAEIVAAGVLTAPLVAVHWGAAEAGQVAARDRGAITVFWSSTALQPPRQVSLVVMRLGVCLGGGCLK